MFTVFLLTAVVVLDVSGIVFSHNKIFFTECIIIISTRCKYVVY